jgi:hypothetical protein
VFAGEAALVEQGVTNELFTVKRYVSNTSGCIFNPLPEDSINPTNTINIGSPASDFASDVTNPHYADRLADVAQDVDSV